MADDRLHWHQSSLLNQLGSRRQPHDIDHTAGWALRRLIELHAEMRDDLMVS